MLSVSSYVESGTFSHNYEMNVLYSDLIDEQLANFAENNNSSTPIWYVLYQL